MSEQQVQSSQTLEWSSVRRSRKQRSGGAAPRRTKSTRRRSRIKVGGQLEESRSSKKNSKKKSLGGLRFELAWTVPRTFDLLVSLSPTPFNDTTCVLLRSPSCGQLALA